MESLDLFELALPDTNAVASAHQPLAVLDLLTARVPNLRGERRRPAAQCGRVGAVGFIAPRLAAGVAAACACDDRRGVIDDRIVLDAPAPVPDAQPVHVSEVAGEVAHAHEFAQQVECNDH